MIADYLAEELPNGVVFTDKDATIALVVDIEEVVEESFELPLSRISLTGSNTAYTYTKSSTGTSDKAVTLNVRGVASEVKALTADGLTAMLDVSSYGEGEYDLPLAVVFDGSLEMASQAYVHVTIASNTKNTKD